MAKSTLTLEFTKNISVNTRVTVSIKMGSSGNHTAVLKAAAIRRGKGDFVVMGGNNEDHAFYAVNTWNSDYKDVGGTNNIRASYVTSNSNPAVRIIIDNENWSFNSVSVVNVTPNEITFNYTNAIPPSAKSFTHAVTTGNCTHVNYSISITGGSAPNTISGLPGDSIQIGSAGTFQLRRGSPAVVRVTDSSGSLVQQKTIVPPKKLNASDFSITVVPENNWNTARISPNVVLASDVTPITYSIDGGAYQSSGSFPDLDFETTYTISIKDKYGCVVTKQFVTLEDLGTGLPQQQYRVFKISNAGTLIFAERQEMTANLRRNPLNSNSCNEYNSLSYSYVHEFYKNDTVKQQFKSSYSYHKVTLITDGSAKFITPLLQSENLNQLEKVDAKIFSTAQNKMGMYFDGGSRYVPGTSTATTESFYGTSTFGEDNFPAWATVGQIVQVDGIGNLEIKRITTDSSRGLYIEFSSPYTSIVDEDVLVQANFNRQDYNTYEFEFPISSVDGSGRIIIEAGFDGLVERTFVSEGIRVVEDDYKRALIQWYDPLNKAGIVHQTGITHFARMYVKLDHKPVDDSEVYNGDSDVYNINQEVYTVADFETAIFGYKMNHKLSLASGMENFYINNVPYRKESMDSERQGDSNIWIKKGVLRMTGNELNVNDSELVLDPPSTPITGEPIGVPNVLAYNDGRLVLNGSGGFLLV